MTIYDFLIIISSLVLIGCVVDWFKRCLNADTYDVTGLNGGPDMDKIWPQS